MKQPYVSIKQPLARTKLPLTLLKNSMTYMYLPSTFIKQPTYPSTFAIHTSRNTSQKLQKSLAIFNAP